jgi:hypothetical protein
MAEVLTLRLTGAQASSRIRYVLGARPVQAVVRRRVTSPTPLGVSFDGSYSPFACGLAPPSRKRQAAEPRHNIEPRRCQSEGEPSNFQCDE